MGLDKNKIEEQIYKLKKIQENIHAILYALEENRQRMKEILDMLQADSSAVSGMWNGLIEDCTRNIYEIEHMQAKYTEYQMWLEKYLCFFDGEDLMKSQSTHAFMIRPVLPPEEIADLLGVTLTQVEDLLEFTLPSKKVDNLPEATLPSEKSDNLPQGTLPPDEKNITNSTETNQVVNYDSECESETEMEQAPVPLDKVYFSAIAPKSILKGEYSMIEIFMYEEKFRHVVDAAIVDAETAVREKKSGAMKAGKEAKITIVLNSPDIEITDGCEKQIWHGEYLNFSFAVELPEDFQKKQILFVAEVYIDDVIATRLKFIAKCTSAKEQKIEITREDVLSAFMSYASQDRQRVARIIQGMRKARPDIDIFFDVDSLRSGDDWEQALWREIDKRDVLFLCWSGYARESKWVDAEWRYAYKSKGPEYIEPVPIDPPSKCPPPEELAKKHFNDNLLYIINAEKDRETIPDKEEWTVE